MVSTRTIVTAVATAASAAAVAGAIWAARDTDPGGPVTLVAPPTATVRAAPSPPSAAPAHRARPAARINRRTEPKLHPARRVEPRPKPQSHPTPHRTLHEFVAASAPNAFSYRGRNFMVHATVCGMDYVRPLDPPGEQHHTVCWVQHDFGYAPGSAGRGTTYVLGHSWAEDPAEVLNPVSERATRQLLNRGRTPTLDGIRIHPVTALNGDVISLRTETGLLRYTVHSAYAVDKQQAGYISTLMDEHIRHRVVLITCAELGGVDYDYNIIVNALLSSSRAFRT